MFRLFIRRGSLSPKSFAFWIYVVSLVPSIFLSRYLERIGSPRYDTATGTLISSGEDLSRPGVLEWTFDVVYITCEFIFLHYIFSPVDSRVVSKGHVKWEADFLGNGFGRFTS